MACPFLCLLAVVLLAAGVAAAQRQDTKGEPTDKPTQPAPRASRPPQPAANPGSTGPRDPIRCANLIYGGTKSSVCFSDKFLDRVQRETNVETDRKFVQVRLASDDLFQYPFAIMAGEGSFAMPEGERKNLRSYLTRGGFLLASAGCSSKDWDRSFRAEIKKVFPDIELKKIPLDHPIYHTVFDVKDIRLSHGGKSLLEGLEHEGKIVLIYSPEGLNDTPNVKGCCCCGGNEVQNCQEINVNILVYALTH